MSVQRSYTKEYKLQAVEMCKLPGANRNIIAKELGVSTSTVYRWVEKYAPELLSENRIGLDDSNCSNEELRQLHREVKRLKLENEILKKTVIIFTNQSEKDLIA